MKTTVMLRKSFRQLPRLLALYLLAMLALMVLTGCRQKAQTATRISGTYQLVSVDGKSVPCEAKHGDALVVIHSGKFQLNPDGTCSSSMNFSANSRTNLNHVVNASYSVADTELTMKWEHAGMTKGQVVGNTFTMTNEGMVLSYQKQ